MGRSANDGADIGKVNASHAEKQLSIISSDPIGVTKPMCKDCQSYFSTLAQSSGKEYVVADPNVTRVFTPDGKVKVYDKSGKLIE